MYWMGKTNREQFWKPHVTAGFRAHALHDMPCEQQLYSYDAYEMQKHDSTHGARYPLHLNSVTYNQSLQNMVLNTCSIRKTSAAPIDNRAKSIYGCSKLTILSIHDSSMGKNNKHTLLRTKTTSVTVTVLRPLDSITAAISFRICKQVSATSGLSLWERLHVRDAP